ncbi:hypothetical protein OX284_009050 [Flavobacterium sp. SUN046]|uniref:hypothetical protein n=1 Tax=Flavobacterium sp. SUN046 TaxID=3002440 RepID=UPI002DBEADAF|nr:hypothetical protein [Flavobacterium sp. SUN046]MEC4049573.1 hypothetical protein [Flavobacterium sp. SUN046]
MNFRIFRYHLSPLSKQNTNLTIDGKSKRFTEQEIKTNKNIFFEKILNSIDFYNNKRKILKIELNENDFFVIKLANKKYVNIVENFTQKDIPTEPFVYILIYNNKDVQKIAISHNSDAFSSPTVVKNILFRELDKNLNKYGLTIQIEELYHKEAVWRMIGAHKNELKSLEIKYVKPNLAEISSSLPENFKKLTEMVNSQESSINLKAPSNGTLEKIDKNNVVIKGLIDYTSQGAGNVKIGIKGYKKKISSKDTPVEIDIEEAVFEGKPDEVIEAIKHIFN